MTHPEENVDSALVVGASNEAGRDNARYGCVKHGDTHIANSLEGTLTPGLA